MVGHAVVLDRGQQRAAFLKQNGIGEVNNLYSTPLPRVEITRCLVSSHFRGIRMRVFFNLAFSLISRRLPLGCGTFAPYEAEAISSRTSVERRISIPFPAIRRTIRLLS